MSATHMLGPLVTFSADGPNLAWGGTGLLDPRQGYAPGQDYTVPILGWTGNTMLVMDQVPAATAVAVIAANQVPTAAVPLTLVSATGGGITAGASVTNLATGALVTGLLAIDGAPAVITTRALQAVQIYDPRRTCARAVTVNSTGNDLTATFIVRGYDLYGQPMSETITGSNAVTATGKKAFKFIASVTPAGTPSGSNVNIGISNVIGFPLYTPGFEFARIFYGNPATPANVLINSGTGFVIGDTTAVTATTGDVRGTYTLQTAADGTNKLSMYLTIPPWNLAADANGVYSGIFGLTNFSA